MSNITKKDDSHYIPLESQYSKLEEIFNQMIRRDPDKRPTAEQLV